MARARLFGLAIIVATLALPGVAAGQDRIAWEQGTTLALFGGTGVSGSHAGGAAGAAVGWELLPYLTIEGSGTWIADRGDTDGFAGLIGTRVGLLPRGTVVPFVSAAVGVYRASFHANPDLPGFYGRRIGATIGPRSQHVFDDFLVALGGGTDVWLARHIALRPDVRVMLTRAEGDTRPITVIGVHLAYHFENHPVTP